MRLGPADWQPPDRHGWQKRRTVATSGPCEIDPEHGAGNHGDHILPRRLAQTCEGKDPDDPINLMGLCAACHGKKTAAERRLYRGDLLGFLQILRCGGWDMDRVDAALRHYGYR